MEAATHAMAPETSNMCDTHTVGEAAPAEMSGTKAAIHTYGATRAMIETGASEMGGTYAVVETHARMPDRSIGVDPHMAEAMVGVLTVEYGRIAVVAVVVRPGAAVSRIVVSAGRASVGLRSGRLRSNECGHGQPNTSSQQDHFGRQFAADHRSLLWGLAPSV
jgi:hypothetical protein